MKRFIAPLEQLEECQAEIEKAKNLNDLKLAMRYWGLKIGYRAFCYLVLEKTTPEEMKELA